MEWDETAFDLLGGRSFGKHPGPPALGLGTRVQGLDEFAQHAARPSAQWAVELV